MNICVVIGLKQAGLTACDVEWAVMLQALTVLSSAKQVMVMCEESARVLSGSCENYLPCTNMSDSCQAC